MESGRTRRTLLGQAAVTAAALSVPRSAFGAGAASRPVVPLPTGAQLRTDVQRMVDMGPRYTGTAGHGRFIGWLEQELTDAGVVMLAPDHEKLMVWEASGFGLDLLDGPAKGKARISSYYPRSQETGPAGVTGPLVYGGTPGAPAPGLDAQGAIVVVDVPMPAPLTVGLFLPLATYLHWDGHSDADWTTIDYKRPWIAPGVSGIPLAPFKALGAAGVVFILDAPYEALNGNYLPFENAFEDLPALFVDRDTGAQLRAAALARPRARLRLEATRRAGTSPALLGYLPGTTKADEALILDTHTDGEGFVEENGGIAMVHLARHFASLPDKDRLRRTLVFSLWPGHMASGMPQLEGVIDKHGDIVRSAAAAITIEHLGCTEWIDTADKGYHATGEAEVLGVWTTQGKVFDIVKAQTIAHDVPRAALLRPPVQFGVGGAFQTAGVPQVGFLAGPYYLLRDSKDGDMDKFDAALAAKQTAWVADILRDMDAVPAAELAAGDPTLGKKKDGRKASFPAAPELALAVTLRTAHRAATKLHGTVSVGRAAKVRMHASLLSGSTTVGLADVLLRLDKAGTTSFALPLSRRARRVLAGASVDGTQHPRVVLRARVDDHGAKVVVSAARRLKT